MAIEVSPSWKSVEMIRKRQKLDEWFLESISVPVVDNEQLSLFLSGPQWVTPEIVHNLLHPLHNFITYVR